MPDKPDLLDVVYENLQTDARLLHGKRPVIWISTSRTDILNHYGIVPTKAEKKAGIVRLPRD